MKKKYEFNKERVFWKDMLLFYALVFAGILIWDLIGLDGGTGGSPYGEPPYYGESI